MHKRDFLKTSGVLLSGSMLPRFVTAAVTPSPAPEALAGAPAVAGTAAAAARTNWSGNYVYNARALETPAAPPDVQALVRTPDLRLKGLGSRHSFNNIADTHGDQVAFPHFDSMELDAANGTVTVGAGITYGKLAPWLDSKGFALHNLASLPHISVVGGTATATHGSGIKNGNLSSAVTALEITTPDGRTQVLRRNPSLAPEKDPFLGSVVHLGALGLVTRISLRVQPTYQMRQVVYENLSFDQVQQHFTEIFSAAYSVSLFTDWQNHRATQVWLKSRVAPGEPPFHIAPEFFGAKAATKKLHPLAGLSAENCTEQLGIPGPWYERLPHFRMNFTPSSGQELQSEFFVPIEHGPAAIAAVETVRDHITPNLLVTEFRTIAADDLWISPCFHQTSLAIHFTWKPDWPTVRNVLPLIEKQLAPFNAKPHWAKLFTMQPAHLRSLHPHMPDFLALRHQTDPHGQFLNEYLQTNLLSA